MTSTLNIPEIYEQNINFLLGSGASFGFLPTLQLAIKGDITDKRYTVETLSVDLKNQDKRELNTLLFMYYYKTCIKPALPLHIDVPFPPDRAAVIEQYTAFIGTVMDMMKAKKPYSRKCNIYTTNYDGCLEYSAENIIKEGSQNITFNDGASGFKKRYFHTKNYTNRIVQKGIFDKHASPIPQINILHLHGSVYWKKDMEAIAVDYQNQQGVISFSEVENALLDQFSAIVEGKNSTLDDLLNLNIDEQFDGSGFWTEYNKLPIVNPTKWKFHETVFEENYYQMLRHLSFELERPNTTFITFGFSFADEHILHLVQRSLSNPSLTLYVCCFDSDEEATMNFRFKGYPNVRFLCCDESLTFEKFNSEIFSLAVENKIADE